MSETTTIYQAKPINTSHSTATWCGWNTLASDLQNGYIVLWQYHGVFVGIISNGNITWQKIPEADDKHIERIRAFNESKEYHFWRSNGILKGRLRVDEDSGETLCVDTAMLLRSVVANQLKLLDAELAASNNIQIKTRNYIDYNETGQAGYVDSRFLKIVKK